MRKGKEKGKGILSDGEVKVFGLLCFSLANVHDVFTVRFLVSCN